MICECKMDDEFDIHESWHKVWSWNKGVFEAARRKSYQEFDKLLAKQEKPSRSESRLDI